MTVRNGKALIMFRVRSGYYTFDDLKIHPQSLSFRIDNDPKIAPTPADIKIVRLARTLLSKEEKWHQNDDRKCNDDLANGTYSLYCALRMASLEIENKYNHRNAVLQKLRHLIEEKYPKRKWNHRLMDFNNMEETTYEDILNILQQMESDFVRSLDVK